MAVVIAEVPSSITPASKKKPISLPQETHSNTKRDPLQYQKRPTPIPKETHSGTKRDPLQYQKTPTPITEQAQFVHSFKCLLQMPIR